MKAGWIGIALCVALVGCAAPSGGNSDGPPGAAADETPAATPPPVKMGPDGPEPPDVEELVAYGDRHRDTFGGMYIDPPGGNRVVMLFTDDLDEHATAVAEILPGTEVRGVRFTEAALLALLESLDFDAMAAEGMEMVSAELDTIGNRVTLDLKSNDPTAEVRLELAHGGMLDVTVHPIPGDWANATEGDGWRLLEAGEGPGSEAYTVRAATSAAEWAEMREALGLDSGEAPPVDFATEVAVSFAHGIGSSCPELRLDGVGIEDGLVYSVTSDPLAPRACTDDLAGAAVFVVAVSRDAVPADGFTLRLYREPAGFTQDVEVALP